MYRASDWILNTIINFQEGSYNTKFLKTQSNNQSEYERMRPSLFSRSYEKRSNYTPLPNTSIYWNRTGKMLNFKEPFHDKILKEKSFMTAESMKIEEWNQEQLSLKIQM